MKVALVWIDVHGKRKHIECYGDIRAHLNWQQISEYRDGRPSWVERCE